MNKHKMFLYLFSGISVVRVLIEIFFKNCYINRHMWLVYASYFLIIGVVLFANFPTVPLACSVKKVECIMLGDGTLTQEIFDAKKQSEFSLVCETELGRAYSSNNGEMIYTKLVKMKCENDDTVLSLFIYIFLYTLAGLCIYDIIEGVVQGTIDINIPIKLVADKLKTLNVLSSRYGVANQLNYAWECIVHVYGNFIKYFEIGVRLIMEVVS